MNRGSEIHIIKTISPERFRKNALGNEQVLAIIGDDLIYYWHKARYGDLLFKVGVNGLLYGEHKKGLSFLKKSLRFQFSLKNLCIYFFALFSKKLVFVVYKKYIGA